MSATIATLTVSSKSDLKHTPQPVIVSPEGEVTIGRGHKCDMAFCDMRSVSHHHCIVRNRDGVVELKPVGTNKTLVNGVVACNDEWHILRDGTTITVSTDPRIRVDLSICSTNRRDKISDKERSHMRRRRANAIAIISSSRRPSYEYIVSAEGEAAGKIEVSIGRAPKST